MKTRHIALVLGFVVAVVTNGSVASAQDDFGLDYSPVLVSETNGIQLWSLPQPAPNDGLLATRLVFRSVDPAATDIVTFDGLRITGDLIQVSTPGPFGADNPTPTKDNFLVNGGVFSPWEPHDTHLSLTSSMIGGGAGAGFAGVGETNDRSQDGQASQAPQIQGISPILGLGDLGVASATDAFFLGSIDSLTGEPINKDEVEIAYVVTWRDPATDNGLGVGRGNISLSVGVLGDGFEPIAFEGDIPFPFPEPSTGVLAGLCSLLALTIHRRHLRMARRAAQ